MDALLLPFGAALPKKYRRLPPPCTEPLTRAQRVVLLGIRDRKGFFLWHPADKLDHGEMTKDGFGGSDRTMNGIDDANPETISLEEMAELIQQKGAA